MSLYSQIRTWFAPPHPTWQSQASRDRIKVFLEHEQVRVPHGIRCNLGSASKRFQVNMLNVDLCPGENVDLQGDIQRLPFGNESMDTVVCTGVLEHVRDPHQAVNEIFRVLKPDGRVFFETPFMQTVHASPNDFSRWTQSGLQQLLQVFELGDWHIVAGPGTALAWQFQETMAMLCSCRMEILYRIGLRIFGWLAIPISWFDMVLEHHPMASQAASGYAVIALKPIRSR